jgi:hypothetical protein
MDKADTTALVDDLLASGTFSVPLLDTVLGIVRSQLRHRRMWAKSPALLGYPFSS